MKKTKTKVEQPKPQAVNLIGLASELLGSIVMLQKDNVAGTKKEANEIVRKLLHPLAMHRQAKAIEYLVSAAKALNKEDYNQAEKHCLTVVRLIDVPSVREIEV